MAATKKQMADYEARQTLLERLRQFGLRLGMPTRPDQREVSFAVGVCGSCGCVYDLALEERHRIVCKSTVHTTRRS